MVVMDVRRVLGHGNVQFVYQTIITMGVRVLIVSLQTVSAAQLTSLFVMAANLALA